MSEHIKEALSILDQDGPLSRSLKGYEPREQQRQMLLNVLQAYEEGGIALVEAGTGTGKSLAYLIPAVLWALKYKERTVISTNTINLQEQLIQKDIPLLLKALNVDLKAVLVKGMGNYVCLRKLDAIKHELRFLSLRKPKNWKPSKLGAKTPATVPALPSPSSPLTRPGRTQGLSMRHCNRRDCPLFQDCFYFKARRQAENAQILVINHHLLYSDLIKREEKEDKGDNCILPDYTRVILDETHHLEDIATDFFASHASLMEIYRNLHKLSAENQPNSAGKLFAAQMPPECL